MPVSVEPEMWYGKQMTVPRQAGDIDRHRWLQVISSKHG